MPGASTIRTRDDISAKPRRPAGPSVAAGAAIRQSGANGQRLSNITCSILDDRSLSVRAPEFALKQLAAPADGAEGIAIDDKEGGVWGQCIAATGPDFLRERLGDPFVQRIGRQGAID